MDPRQDLVGPVASAPSRPAIQPANSSRVTALMSRRPTSPAPATPPRLETGLDRGLDKVRPRVRREIILPGILLEHAPRAETRHQGGHRAAYSWHPFARQSLRIPVVEHRDHFLRQHLVKVLAVPPVLFLDGSGVSIALRWRIRWCRRSPRATSRRGCSGSDSRGSRPSCRWCRRPPAAAAGCSARHRSRTPSAAPRGRRSSR